MSFSNGFEKTASLHKEAFLGSAIGYAGGMARRMTGGFTGAVKGFAKRQEANRILSYQKGLGNPTTPEAVARLQRMRSKNPNFLQNMQKQTSWFRRHPYLTLGGAYLGAKMMMGGQPQPPPPPPQVVQY